METDIAGKIHVEGIVSTRDCLLVTIAVPCAVYFLQFGLKLPRLRVPLKMQVTARAVTIRCQCGQVALSCWGAM